ncbi:MAG: hypothetical protein ACPGQL_09915 [Thermoplasmatota archaeon]
METPLEKPGRVRPLPSVIVLYAATLGLYALYYWLVVYREVFQAAGRRWPAWLPAGAAAMVVVATVAGALAVRDDAQDDPAAMIQPAQGDGDTVMGPGFGSGRDDRPRDTIPGWEAAGPWWLGAGLLMVLYHGLGAHALNRLQRERGARLAPVAGAWALAVVVMMALQFMAGASRDPYLSVSALLWSTICVAWLQLNLNDFWLANGAADPTATAEPQP